MSRLIDADALIEFCAERWIPLNIDAVNMQPTIQPEKAQLLREGTTSNQPVATDTNVGNCSEIPNSSDAINRQDAIDALDKRFDNIPMQLTEEILKLRKDLRELPPIQPERKKGEWLPDNNNAYEMRFVCSCCKESEVVPTIGFTKYKPLWDFCPNCGADMRGEKDE